MTTDDLTIRVDLMHRYTLQISDFIAKRMQQPNDRFARRADGAPRIRMHFDEKRSGAAFRVIQQSGSATQYELLETFDIDLHQINPFVFEHGIQPAHGNTIG